MKKKGGAFGPPFALVFHPAAIEALRASLS